RGCWRGRPPIDIRSSMKIEEITFLPIKEVKGLSEENAVEIYDYELEALKLIHIDNLTTDEASLKMGISKATFWRVLEDCRFKIAMALLEQKPIKIVSKSLEEKA
ncbi:MAG: DUF134 domain-containing protein, partial [Fervidicoccus fontis]